MNKKKILKEVALLIVPLLLFAILIIPYSWLNQQFIVEWLGCGCPKVDELGNIIQPDFNANDFTSLFWFFISLCVAIFSVILSKRIPKNKMWIRVIYVTAMILVSLLFSYHLCKLMMWN